MNENVRWTLDAHRCLNLLLNDATGRPIHVWIAPRNMYCDRGHWEVKVDAPGLWLDDSDRFPRFYMALSTAIQETEAWLRWRLYRYTTTPTFTEMLADHDTRQAFVAPPKGWEPPK